MRPRVWIRGRRSLCETRFGLPVAPRGVYSHLQLASRNPAVAEVAVDTVFIAAEDVGRDVAELFGLAIRLGCRVRFGGTLGGLLKSVRDLDDELNLVLFENAHVCVWWWVTFATLILALYN